MRLITRAHTRLILKIGRMSLILPHYEHLSHNEPHYEAHQMSGRVKCECEYQCEQSERGVNTSCEQCRRGLNDVV